MRKRMSLRDERMRFVVVKTAYDEKTSSYKSR